MVRRFAVRIVKSVGTNGDRGLLAWPWGGADEERNDARRNGAATDRVG